MQSKKNWVSGFLIAMLIVGSGWLVSNAPAAIDSTAKLIADLRTDLTKEQRGSVNYTNDVSAVILIRENLILPKAINYTNDVSGVILIRENLILPKAINYANDVSQGIGITITTYAQAATDNAAHIRGVLETADTTYAASLTGAIFHEGTIRNLADLVLAASDVTYAASFTGAVWHEATLRTEADAGVLAGAINYTNDATATVRTYVEAQTAAAFTSVFDSMFSQGFTASLVRLGNTDANNPSNLYNLTSSYLSAAGVYLVGVYDKTSTILRRRLISLVFENSGANYSPEIDLYRARGTPGAPEAVQAGDILGKITFGGPYGTDFSKLTEGPYFRCKTTAAWSSSSSKPSKCELVAYGPGLASTKTYTYTFNADDMGSFDAPALIKGKYFNSTTTTVHAYRENGVPISDQWENYANDVSQTITPSSSAYQSLTYTPSAYYQTFTATVIPASVNAKFVILNVEWFTTAGGFVNLKCRAYNGAYDVVHKYSATAASTTD